MFSILTASLPGSKRARKRLLQRGVYTRTRINPVVAPVKPGAEAVRHRGILSAITEERLERHPRSKDMCRQHRDMEIK